MAKVTHCFGLADFGPNWYDWSMEANHLPTPPAMDTATLPRVPFVAFQASEPYDLDRPKEARIVVSAIGHDDEVIFPEDLADYVAAYQAASSPYVVIFYPADFSYVPEENGDACDLNWY
jgi:hypothetical protein